METKKLIPYSVHLPEHLYNQIRLAASERRASSIIRDALEAYFAEQTSVELGRQQGIVESIRVVQYDPLLSGWAFKGRPLNEMIANKLSKLLPKETKRAKAKT